MKDLSYYTLKKSDTMQRALSVIDKGAMRIAVVVEDGKVIGTLNDGDIRRALLKGCTMQTEVAEIFNASPIVCSMHDSENTVIQKALEKKVYQIPIVDDTGALVDLVDFASLLEKKRRKNKIVLMAGGLGKRLEPLTKKIPQPLLSVGSKPILETIIDNFAKQGFTDIVISINYKGEMIKEYFGDGEAFGVCISYIEEQRRLGTAGALSLLEFTTDDPIIVMNADLLTNIDFSKLIGYHTQTGAKATMCVRDYDFQVPYGVIDIDNDRIVAIKEKPVYKFFVNAGIYVLNPDVIDCIPKNQFFDMPSLFEKLMVQKEEIASFPIHEYWIDIGKMLDYQRANDEYHYIFGK